MSSIRKQVEIFLVALRLGLTSFGGPVAHLAYFQNEYVKRKKWLSDQTYAEIVAICQFLPGPASSQVGISIGMLRGGMLGGFLAWIGFTLPSVLLLSFFAYYVIHFDVNQSVIIHSLKIVAVAVVAHAILSMGKNLASDLPRISLAIGSAVLILLFPTASIQIIIIVLAGLIGSLLFKKDVSNQKSEVTLNISKSVGMISLSIFTLLLISLPVISGYFKHLYIQLFDTFYRVGSLVFGGGHVVLPLLEKEIVPNQMTNELFLAGYGAAQAVPGPLFTFASYLGMSIDGIGAMIIATVAIFLPSFLLITAILPFWNSLSQNQFVRSALVGVNAAVVGVLLAAFYDPIFTSGITSSVDFAVAVLSFSLLQFFKRPAWLVVLLTVAIYVIIHQLI